MSVGAPETSRSSARCCCPCWSALAGLGMETAWWYSRQRELQGAADIAAYDATLKRRDGGTATEATTVATADRRHEPLEPADRDHRRQQPADIGWVSERPGGRGDTDREPAAVPQPRSCCGNTPITVTARSTATMRTGDPACILGLNTAASDTVKFWGNSYDVAVQLRRGVEFDQRNGVSSWAVRRTSRPLASIHPAEPATTAD